MNHLRSLGNIALLFCVYLATAGNEGCTLYQGQMEGKNFKFAITPQVIEGSGILGGVLSALGITFPFETAFPAAMKSGSQIEEVYLSELALRSTRPDDFDSNGDVIKTKLFDDTRIISCEGNQQPLNFLNKFEIFIQKEGSSEVPVRIASYVKSQGNAEICGFFMNIEINPNTGKAYNIKPFLPRYVITTKAEGTAPVNDVEVTGYVSVDWLAPNASVVVPPPEQEQTP